MKNKERFNKLTSYYFKTTTRIFEMGLDSKTIAVFCYIASVPETYNPGIRLIARKLRMSKSTVIKALNILREHNIILRLTGGHQGQNAQYEFVPPKEWYVKKNTRKSHKKRPAVDAPQELSDLIPEVS